MKIEFNFKVGGFWPQKTTLPLNPQMKVSENNYYTGCNTEDIKMTNDFRKRAIWAKVSPSN